MSDTFSALGLMGILETLWEWLIAVALTFWIGTLVIESVVLDGKEQRAAFFSYYRQRARPAQWFCLSVLLVAEVVALFLRSKQFTQSLHGNALDSAVPGLALFQSAYGYIWIVREILLLGSLALLMSIPSTNGADAPTATPSGARIRSWWTTSHRQRPFVVALLILAGLILITYALPADAARLFAYVVALNWLTLAAQGTWFGGLAYLVYIFMPLLAESEPERRSGTLAAILWRFYPLVLGAMCVVLFNELYLTTTGLSNIQQFSTEPYGRTLLVQWALILLMILFSVYALFVLRPGMAKEAALLPLANSGAVRQSEPIRTARDLQKTFRVQSWLAAAVLLCSVLLAFFAPPVATKSQTTTTGTSSNLLSTQTKQVGNLSVTLAVIPGKIHVANTVTVKIIDTRSNQFVMKVRIMMSTNMYQMDMGTVRATMMGGTPIYSATFAQDTTFSMTGIWEITLTIQLPQQAQDTVLFQVWMS